ncbi:IS66 family insertion sequence element accessory protein TnpA [Peptoclostridium acidaminophilum]|uniref:IS66 family insertion sequence element accessory protein TnpA n=1 Tax=Peptoclostridium acidaminophilum TaxID=1731 RepID=UPI00046D5F04|nr:hypothetical protein [Peptoclostridium acidaminophilum]
MISNELDNLWEQRLAQYEASGQSVTTWCKEQTIRENQFYYWRKKLRTDKDEKTQPPVQWLPLDLQLSKQVSPVGDLITVHIGKAAVELRKGFDQSLLREIIQVLQTI